MTRRKAWYKVLHVFSEGQRNSTDQQSNISLEAIIFLEVFLFLSLENLPWEIHRLLGEKTGAA
jgi:hypothetical protein